MNALWLDRPDFQRRSHDLFGMADSEQRGGHGNNEATDSSPKPSVRPVSSLLRRFSPFLETRGKEGRERDGSEAAKPRTFTRPPPGIRYSLAWAVAAVLCIIAALYRVIYLIRL